MRDFQDDDNRMTWDEKTEMTQKGFKRFRRKATGDRDDSGRDPLLLEHLPGDRPSPIPAPRPEPQPNLPATIRDDWDVIPQVSPERRSFARARGPLVNLDRDAPAARSFDLLRTRLLQTLRERGWRRVAVTSPVSGCGATFTAVNLALSLARVPDSRTILMDLNARAPGVGPALGLPATADMSAFLRGERAMREHLTRVGGTLALGLAGGSDRDAAERLLDPRTGQTLERMIDRLDPDVVLYDLPPVLGHDDVAAFLPHVDGVLVVADGTRTTADEIAACQAALNGHSQLLGVVLNRARPTRKGMIAA
jgi:Mrp family chromosome partitioning ATPase